MDNPAIATRIDEPMPRSGNGRSGPQGFVLRSDPIESPAGIRLGDVGRYAFEED